MNKEGYLYQIKVSNLTPITAEKYALIHNGDNYFYGFVLSIDTLSNTINFLSKNYFNIHQHLNFITLDEESSAPLSEPLSEPLSVPASFDFITIFQYNWNNNIPDGNFTELFAEVTRIYKFNNILIESEAKNILNSLLIVIGSDYIYLCQKLILKNLLVNTNQTLIISDNKYYLPDSSLKDNTIYKVFRDIFIDNNVEKFMMNTEKN